MIPRVLVPTFLLVFLPSALAQDNWEQTRSIAQSQHEIIILLIQKREFDKVPDAVDELLQLSFPAEHEDKLVEEIRILTDALIPENQSLLAHQILDSALKVVVRNHSKAELHKEKAYIYKKEGKADRAMECFEKSKELERQPGP